MKRTRKLILALVVVMSLLMAMAVAVIPASAETNIPANTVLYLKPSNTWKTDGARFAAYFFGNGEAWVSMTDNDGDGIYECTSPNKSYTNVIFCRMNPNAAANNWNNKWNQTGNLTFVGNKNYYEPTEGWWDTMGDSCWTKHQCFDGPAATCETDQTCPLCGNVQKAKLGHSYDDGVVTTKPTCTESGVKTFTCSTCEGTKTEDVASLGHNFVEGVCDREGCDAEDPDYCAHSNVTHYEAKDATCTENGNIEYWLCVDCGQAWLDEAQTLNTNVLAVVLPTIDHSYKAFVTEPTCIKAGYTTYTCDCGDSYTEAGAAATGHNHVNNICTVCGHAEYIYIYFQNNWFWSDINVYYWNANDTYNAAWPGAEAEFVKNDGSYDIYLVKIPTDFNATGIIFNGVKNDGSGDTDQTPDINDFAPCSVYSMKWDNGNKVDVKVAHNYTESVTNEATCTEAGLKTFTCLCGDTYTEEIPATGHTYMDGVCNCGEKINVLEKNSEGVIVLSGSLDANGVIVFTKDSVIDLNGNTLTANGVITFHETTRFVGEGKLVIPQNGLVLAGETNNMPVWNATSETEGYYTFPTVRTQFVEEPKVIDHDSFNVVFRPTLNDSTKLNQSVFANANAHGLTFCVEIYGKGNAEALYSGNVSNDLIAEAYANGKAISLTVNGADTDYEEYTVKLVVVSSTGLVNTTEIGRFVPTEAPEVEETPADAN